MIPPATAGQDEATRPPPARVPRSWGVLALAWGFAEATFFFIVPDVFLTWIALRERRAAWRACLWATAGALLGGVVMALLGRLDPSGAREFVGHVPAISPALVDQSEALLRQHGYGAVFSGMVTGKPYKVFAVLAGARGLALPAFLALSLVARLLRFSAVTALASWLAHGPWRAMPHRRKLLILIVVWVIFYSVYFSILGF